MAGAGEGTKYPPSEFSQKYSKVLAPNGKLVSPDEVFGEGKMFDKDVEEKTKLAFKVTLKKLDKMNIESEKNKDNLVRERIDQIVECFPNTMPKDLPDKLQKIKDINSPLNSQKDSLGNRLIIFLQDIHQ